MAFRMEQEGKTNKTADQQDKGNDEREKSFHSLTGSNNLSSPAVSGGGSIMLYGRIDSRPVAAGNDVLRDHLVQRVLNDSLRPGPLELRDQALHHLFFNDHFNRGPAGFAER